MKKRKENFETTKTQSHTHTHVDDNDGDTTVCSNRVYEILFRPRVF